MRGALGGARARENRVRLRVTSTAVGIATVAVLLLLIVACGSSTETVPIPQETAAEALRSKLESAGLEVTWLEASQRSDFFDSNVRRATLQIGDAGGSLINLYRFPDQRRRRRRRWSRRSRRQRGTGGRGCRHGLVEWPTALLPSGSVDRAVLREREPCGQPSAIGSFWPRCRRSWVLSSQARRMISRGSLGGYAATWVEVAALAALARR